MPERPLWHVRDQATVHENDIEFSDKEPADMHPLTVPIQHCHNAASLESVSKQLNIRDIPDDVYRALRITAAERDMSVSEIVRQVLASYAARLPRLSDQEPDFSRIREEVEGVSP